MPTKNSVPKTGKAAKNDKTAKIARPAAEKALPKKKAAAVPAKKVSALAAAARVLGETKLPMRCPELIAAMAAHGYWTSPHGKTPTATLAAAMQREIVVKKDQSRFRKTGPGRFALA
jgi:hypothetical protein